RCISMLTADDKPQLQIAARRLEIFLDYLLAKATDNTAYLLDPTFRGMLSERERRLANYLGSIASDVPVDGRDLPAWRKVEEMLQELGWAEPGLGSRARPG